VIRRALTAIGRGGLNRWVVAGIEVL